MHSLKIETTVWISWSLRDDGRLHSGETITAAIERVHFAVKTQFENRVRLHMVLVNCCLPEAVEVAMEEIVQSHSTLKVLRDRRMRIGIYPNLMKKVAVQMSP